MEAFSLFHGDPIGALDDAAASAPAMALALSVERLAYKPHSPFALGFFTRAG